MNRILLLTAIILSTLTAFSQSKTITYYPYQVRTILPLTGLSITPCNYNDPPVTISFSGDTPISVGSTGLSYHTTNNFGLDIYSYDTNRSNKVGFFITFPSNNDPDLGMTQIMVMDVLGNGDISEIYTDYSTTDMRGSGGYSNGGGYHNGNSYNNGGSHNHSSGTICKSCSGTGKCTLCKGAGYYWQDSGAYVGRTINEKVRCPACNGSGNCQVCYGAGKIR